MRKLMAMLVVATQVFGSGISAQTGGSNSANKLYIDVHEIEGGKVKFQDVVNAHAKDVAVQGKYGVSFKKFWVDEDHGLIYCLSSASDTGSISRAHAEAHGLLPKQILEVTEGAEAAIVGDKTLYMDVHNLGAGAVTAKDVEGAHKKDLAVQKKYGVSFIDYWVDEKRGTVLCLSEAANPESIVAAHKEAHGLIPVSVSKVKQGQ
jgi:uncharacterized protein DUF4242